MTREEALAKAATRWWETATAREIFEFQVAEPLLCVPFDVYHKAAEDTLGRPVFTHEFAKPQWLLEELAGRREPLDPMDSLRAIVGPDKPIVEVVAPGGDGKGEG